MASSFLLDDLIRMPIADRSARVLEFGGDDITRATLAGLGDRSGVPLIDAGRLAWAVAHNVDAGPLAAVRDDAAVQGYRRRWQPDVPWAIVWSILVAPREDGCGREPTSLLRELAWSVACEQRDDWQPPSNRPLSADNANQAFEVLYGRCRSKVVGYVVRRYGERAGDPESIADEAWSRVFQGYWSAEAGQRFSGLSRISTLVCQVGNYIALDEFRRQERMAVLAGDDAPSPGNDENRGQPLGVTDDQVTRMIADRFKKEARDCTRLLPPKQRLVAHLVWFGQHRQVDVAGMLDISEAAVAQHLKKARERVRRCLGEKGFDDAMPDIA